MRGKKNMPLVFTTAHSFRVDFFPRPQFAGVQFASKEQEFCFLKWRLLHKKIDGKRDEQIDDYIDKLAIR